MNKRRSFFTKISAGLLAAVSLVGGMKMADRVYTPDKADANIRQASKQKEAPPTQVVNRNVIVDQIGGMPFARVLPNYGMSPKEYGQLFGNGGSKKSNRLRYAHNAKVKRRMA